MDHKAIARRKALDMLRENLLEWQWSLYKDNHMSRGNLVLHVLTVPMFLASIASLPVMLMTVPLAWSTLPLMGMVLTLVAQGRGHKTETQPPIPFLGPADFVSRFLAEQCITFPRFVLSGEFANAWRRAQTA